MQSGLPFFDLFSRDLRFGFRQLRKSPGFVWTTITIFGLGVGITTAAFSVIDGVLLRPLPYQDPDRLVWIHDGMTQEDTSGWSACMKDFLLWRARSKSFQNLAAFTGDRLTLTGDGRAEELGGADVSAGFFATLGVRPLLGRTFAADADQPGRESEALISERLWREKYAGRDDVLNKSITLDGRPVTVIGIMPSSFQFRLPDVDVWQILPLAPPVRRGPFIFRGVARLKQGVSLAQANAEMAGLARQVELTDPKGAEHLHYPVESLRESILGDVRPLVRALAAAAFLVLLVSVFNIANLILARSVTRQQEIAIRLSIGAGFRRLLRQLLTESIDARPCWRRCGHVPGIPRHRSTPDARSARNSTAGHDRHGRSSSILHPDCVGSLWNDFWTRAGICGHSPRSHSYAERKWARSRREPRTSNAAKFAGGCRDRAFSGTFGMCRPAHPQLSHPGQRADGI
jgi:predicted permease